MKAEGAQIDHQQPARADRLTMLAILCLAVLLIPFYEARAADHSFTSDTTIDATTFTYDGLSILVDGAQLTIEGTHSFTELELINGAVLTHSTATTTKPKLTIGILDIDTNSSIDVTGKGLELRKLSLALAARFLLSSACDTCGWRGACWSHQE